MGHGKAEYIERAAKSILRKQKRYDSWFCSSYVMNLYRGCEHDCSYCDGRDEKYRVERSFGREVEVKINAPEILVREADPGRRRKPMLPGYFFLGGGVQDSYQPAELTYRLARRSLEILYRFGHPVHILTKSVHVLEDIELLRDIHSRSGAVISVSLSSSNDVLARTFEEGASPPSERLEVVRRAKKAGVPSGVYLLPIIPFVTDLPDVLETTFRDIAAAGADFVVVGGMTLKSGRQREHFLRVLETYDPSLFGQFEILYPGDPWGNSLPDYQGVLSELCLDIAARHRLPLRIPSSIFGRVFDCRGRAVIILEHLDYLLRLRGRKTTYGYAARSVAALEEPLETLRSGLRTIPGVGAATERLLREVIDTGSSGYYEKLLSGEG
jgi:DNA repair photolyase